VVNHQMRREQSPGNWRRIATVQSDRRSVNDEINIRDLKPKCRFFPTDRLQSRHRTENYRTFKKIAERIGELLAFLELSICDHEPLAIFLRALKRNGAGRAASAEHEHAQVAEIDRKLLAHRARKSAPVGVE